MPKIDQISEGNPPTHRATPVFVICHSYQTPWQLLFAIKQQGSTSWRENADIEEILLGDEQVSCGRHGWSTGSPRAQCSAKPPCIPI